jgi:hypothetical protein
MRKAGGSTLSIFQKECMCVASTGFRTRQTQGVHLASLSSYGQLFLFSKSSFLFCKMLIYVTSYSESFCEKYRRKIHAKY